MKIPIGKIVFHGNEHEYVASAMDAAQISSQGLFVERFEAEFAKYVGTRYAVSTCNGTAALHLMLAALGIGELNGGHLDQVIVPALTFPATANMVRLTGATVVLCDVDKETWTLDPAEVEKKITPQTRAILPVSLYGCLTDTDELAILADGRIRLLEDGAQGLGAQKICLRIGNLAFATTFSFYGNKTLSCGEGGMVTTNDKALANKMRLLRAHGEDPNRKFWFPELGFNYRMSNLHAAIGCAQLERIEAMIHRRNEIAAGYIERLRPLFQEGRLSHQLIGGRGRHAWWLFSVVLENAHGEMSVMHRGPLQAKLREDGIETRPIFYPLHMMPVYKEPFGTYPVAEHIGLNGLSLPTFEDLTSGEQDFICERLIWHMGAMGL